MRSNTSDSAQAFRGRTFGRCRLRQFRCFYILTIGPVPAPNFVMKINRLPYLIHPGNVDLQVLDDPNNPKIHRCSLCQVVSAALHQASCGCKICDFCMIKNEQDQWVCIKCRKRVTTELRKFEYSRLRVKCQCGFVGYLGHVKVHRLQGQCPHKALSSGPAATASDINSLRDEVRACLDKVRPMMEAMGQLKAQIERHFAGRK